MYLSELIPVVDDLQQLVGSPLLGVWQPKRDRLVVGLGGGLVCIVPRGPFARLGMAYKRPKNPLRPFSFQGACRKHLHGRLESIRVVGGDREVALAFSSGSLCLRLTGRGGGLWLLNDEGVVAGYDGPTQKLPDLPVGTPTGRVARFSPGGDGWALAAERYFSHLETTERRRSQHVAWTRTLRDQHRRLTRLSKNLKGDLAKGSAVATRQRQADALGASLYRVARGSSEVTVSDLEDPSVVYTIRLNPRISPGENLTLLYERLKRSQARTESAVSRLEHTKQQRLLVERALAELEDGNADLAQRLVAATPGRKQRPRAGNGVEVWSNTTGQQLWVGRNALSNRKLTFQKARGRDWWMHIRGRPGAHVVLPVRTGNPPNLEWLLAGAQLAARKSKVGIGDSVDVQYTQIKNVRAIPGDAHGRVTVHSESVLHIVRESSMPEGWIQDDT